MSLSQLSFGYPPGTDGRPFDLYSFGADGQQGGEETDADIQYQP